MQKLPARFLSEPLVQVGEALTPTPPHYFAQLAIVCPAQALSVLVSHSPLPLLPSSPPSLFPSSPPLPLPLSSPSPSTFPCPFGGDAQGDWPLTLGGVRGGGKGGVPREGF